MIFNEKHFIYFLFIYTLVTKVYFRLIRVMYKLLRQDAHFSTKKFQYTDIYIYITCVSNKTYFETN